MKPSEILTLGTPRGRIVFYLIATSIVFVVPFRWLVNLSPYKWLGLDFMPSIGLTRAYWHLIHGHPRLAFEMNWLIYPVLLIWLSIMARDILNIRADGSIKFFTLSKARHDS